MESRVETDIQCLFTYLKETCITDAVLLQAAREIEDWPKLCVPHLLNETFNTYSAEERKLAVQSFISCVAQEFVPNVIAACLDFFHVLIQAGIVTAKQVCDELLLPEEDLAKNITFFSEAAHLIQKILPQVDYKGCRDIFAKVLGLCRVNGEADQLLFQPAFRIITTLMDRSQCLMPAYFALHVATKLPVAEQNQQHPALREKLDQFRDSFHDVATLFTHKTALVPIAGLNNFCLHQPSGGGGGGGGGSGGSGGSGGGGALAASSVVNPAQNKSALELKGPLPYDQELTQSIKIVMRCLLAQPAGMELVISELPARSQKSPRCPFLERCLIETILWAVDQTDDCSSDSDMAWADMLWRHLCLSSIHLCRYHMVRFPELCQGLYEGLQSREISQQSCSHIAWLLFNFFGAQQKNPLSDFALILRIVDRLYPDGASGFDTPLLIWRSITQKSSLATEQLPRSLPPQLRPLMNELDEQFKLMSKSSAALQLEPQQFRWFAYVYNAYAPLVQSQAVSTLNSKLMEALKQPDSSALPFASLRQLAIMSLFAMDKLLQSLLDHKVDCGAVLETLARTTVLMHHDLNLQPKSVLLEALRADQPRLAAFVIELASFQLINVDPKLRQALATHLATVAKTGELTLDIELCLYRQVQLLLTPALQLTPNHVKKLYVGLISGCEQEELNRYLLMQLQHQIVQQHADPALLTDFAQPLFQKCSGACQLPASMLHRFATCDKLTAPDRCLTPPHLQQEATRLAERFLKEGHLDEAGVLQSGCLFSLALRCLAERGDLPVALFSRLAESLSAKAALQHLRLFVDLLLLELRALDPAASVGLLNHVTSLVFSHKLLPLHRLLLVLALRPLPSRDLEEAALQVIGHLLSKEAANSPVGGFVEALNRAQPGCSLASLVAELRTVHDDAAPHLLFGHCVTRSIVIMDCILARILQLLPANGEQLLDTLAPFLRHYPNPIGCALTLLRVYSQPAPPRLLLKLAMLLLGPRIESSPAEAYLPAGMEAALRRAAAGDLQSAPDDAARQCLARLSDCVRSLGRSGYPQLDWAQHEFPGPLPHAVACAALQLLLLQAMPNSHAAGGLRLSQPDTDWNSAGLLVAQLPQSMANELVLQPVLAMLEQFGSVPPGQFFAEAGGRYELQLWYAFMSHAGPGRACRLPQLFHEQFRPRVASESQLLLVCQLIGPLLSDALRLHNAAQNDIVTELYHCLAKVAGPAALHHQDTIADFFYHIKYMFVGDGVRKTAAATIEKLSPGLQRRLRSIAPVQHIHDAADHHD